MRHFLLSAAALAAVALPAAASAETYTIDPSHTNILLRINHLGFSDMTLEALQPVGTIVFDPANPKASSVTVALKAVNIDGDDAKFNTHLQSPDFFHAEKFPEITFKSTAIDVTGEKTGKITGDLTLMGVTKPITLDVTFNKAGVNPFSQKETVGFSAKGELKRSDFGMNYGLPAVGDAVGIDISLEGVK